MRNSDSSTEYLTPKEMIAESNASLQALMCDAIACNPRQCEILHYGLESGVTYPQLRGIRRKGVIGILLENIGCVLQIDL